MPETEFIYLGLDVFQTLLILAGGLAALYEYRRFRRYGYKAQLDLDFNILPLPHTKGRHFLLDIRPRIKNMGQVRQRFPIVQVWANALTETDLGSVTTSGKGVRFSQRLLTIRNVSHRYDPYFVDPGVSQVFPYIAEISDPGDYVQVIARFYYTVSKWTRLRICVNTWLKREKLKNLRHKNLKEWRKSVKRLARLRRYGVWEFHIISVIKAIN